MTKRDRSPRAKQTTQEGDKSKENKNHLNIHKASMISDLFYTFLSFGRCMGNGVIKLYLVKYTPLNTI